MLIRVNTLTVGGHMYKMTDLSTKDISFIDKMFDNMDIDHDGEISIKELIDGKYCYI